MSRRRDEGSDRFDRGEIDWGWARYEVGRAAIVPSARKAPLPPATRAELALAPRAATLELPRPAWQTYLYAFFGTPLLAALALSGWTVLFVPPLAALMARPTFARVRARWDADHVVIETWPQRRGVKVARADVRAVRFAACRLTVEVEGHEPLPLVIGRRVTAGDLDRAERLADALGVPFGDDRPVPAAPLPAARLLK